MPLRPKAQARPITGCALWCVIYQVARKHVTDNCHLSQIFVQKQQQIFYNFFKSVRHDERNCHSYELMMDKTPTYRVKEETRPLDQGIGGERGEYQGCGRG